jgi:hypothetical protein
MATDRQVEANRRNALLSTGPRTEAGKRISSGNAITIALFSNSLRERLAEDEREAYDAYIDRQANSFAPKGPREEWLAAKLAESMFLIDRAQDLNIQMANEPLDTGRGSRETRYRHVDRMPRMALYTNRLRKNYDSYREELAALQTERKAQELQDMRHLQTIAEAAAITDTKFDPAQIGFVISKKELSRDFLRIKLWNAAAVVTQSPDLTEDRKFAFQERLRQATAVAPLA